MIKMIMIIALTAVNAIFSRVDSLFPLGKVLIEFRFKTLQTPNDSTYRHLWIAAVATNL